MNIQIDTGDEGPTLSEKNRIDVVSNEILDEPTNTSQMLDLPTPPGISIPVDDSSKKKKPANKVKEIDAPDTSTPEVASNNFEVKVKPISNDGQDFVDWFSSGIADGSMPINVSGALVHTVGDEKSLLLVSPLIFRKFAKSRPSISFEQLQRDFQSLNIHKVTPKDTNIWKFKTISDRKNKKSNILSDMLIEDPEEKLKIRLPTSNTHLAST